MCYIKPSYSGHAPLTCHSSSDFTGWTPKFLYHYFQSQHIFDMTCSHMLRGSESRCICGRTHSPMPLCVHCDYDSLSNLVEYSLLSPCQFQCRTHFVCDMLHSTCLLRLHCDNHSLLNLVEHSLLSPCQFRFLSQFICNMTHSTCLLRLHCDYDSLSNLLEYYLLWPCRLVCMVSSFVENSIFSTTIKSFFFHSFFLALALSFSYPQFLTPSFCLFQIHTRVFHTSSPNPPSPLSPPPLSRIFFPLSFPHVLSPARSLPCR